MHALFLAAALNSFSVTAPAEAPPAVTVAAHPVINYAGLVLERGTRRPIPDAQVAIAEIGFTAITDRQGHFSFEDVPAGRYTIVLPILGYQRYKTWEEITEAERIDVVYYVEPDYGSPLEVIVEAEKVKKEVSKTTIKRDELRKVAGTGNDAIRAIASLPGVATSNEMATDLIVRGSGPFDNQIEIDRIEVPYIYHFGGFRSVLNTDLVDTIDFMAGGFGANFGRATGGVLLANTRPGRRDRLGGALDVNTAMSEAYVEGPLGEKGSFVLAGRRSYFDLIIGPIARSAVPEDQLTFTVFPQFYDYQLRGDYELVTGTTITGFVFGADDIMKFLIQRTNPRDPDLTGSFLIHPFYHVVAGSVRHKGTRFTTRTQLHFGLLGQDIEIGKGNHLNFRTRTPGLTNDSSYRLAKWNTLNFGTQLRYANFRLESRFPQPPKPGQSDFTFTDAKLITTNRTIHASSAAVFVDDMIKVTDRWMLDPGVRLERYEQDRAYNYVDPRFLTRFEVTDTLALKGSVGRYSDFPTEQELDSDYGSPELEPIHSTHYVAGAEYKLTPEDVIDVQAYYKWIDNLVYGYATGQAYRNTAVGEAYGVEIFYRHYLTSRLFGWASYAYSVSRRKYPNDDKWVSASFDQPHIANVVTSYKLTNRWELGFKWRYSSGNLYTPYIDRIYVADTSQYIPITGERNSLRLPDQHRLDARLEYGLPLPTWTMRFYLEVWNLYGAKNAADYIDNYDYSAREPLYMLPIPVPMLGVRAEL